MAKSPIASCGFYCTTCEIYVATTTSDILQKEELADRLSRDQGKKIAADDIHCWGCWASNRHCWGKKCFFRKCAGDKGIDFCYQCHEYPCTKLGNFYKKHPQAKENLTQISKIGIESYVSELIGREEQNE